MANCTALCVWMRACDSEVFTAFPCLPLLSLSILHLYPVQEPGRANALVVMTNLHLHQLPKVNCFHSEYILLGGKQKKRENERTDHHHTLKCYKFFFQFFFSFFSFSFSPMFDLDPIFANTCYADLKLNPTFSLPISQISKSCHYVKNHLPAAACMYVCVCVCVYVCVRACVHARECVRACVCCFSIIIIHNCSLF